MLRRPNGRVPGVAVPSAEPGWSSAVGQPPAEGAGRCASGPAPTPATSQQARSDAFLAEVACTAWSSGRAAPRGSCYATATTRTCGRSTRDWPRRAPAGCLSRRGRASTAGGQRRLSRDADHAVSGRVTRAALYVRVSQRRAAQRRHVPGDAGAALPGPLHRSGLLGAGRLRRRRREQREGLKAGVGRHARRRSRRPGERGAGRQARPALAQHRQPVRRCWPTWTAGASRWSASLIPSTRPARPGG